MTDNVQSALDFVYNEVLSMINSGRGLYFNRLPSENQLARKMLVSRGTVRTALARLEVEGKIRKKHGSGTYVHPLYYKMRCTVYPKMEYTELVTLNGYHSYSKCVKIEKTQNKDIAVQLELPANTTFANVVYVYWADGMPCLYCENLFDMRSTSAECIESIKRNPETPFFEMVDQWYGEKPQWSALQLGSEDGKMFQKLDYSKIELDPPSHCLLLKNIVYGKEDAPMFYAKTFCDTRILDLYIVQNTYSFIKNQKPDGK